MSQARAEKRVEPRAEPEAPESLVGVAMAPGAAALLQYLQVELVDKYLKPLENRVFLLEQRFDYWSTQAIAEITKSSITAAYNVVAQKMEEQLGRIVDERLSRPLAAVEARISELDERARRVEAMAESISAISEKIEKLGAGLKIDTSSIIRELREGLEAQVRSSVEKIDQAYASKLDEFTKEFSRRLGELGSRIEELGGELQNLATILSSILKRVKGLEAGAGIGGEEEVEGIGELGEGEDFGPGGEVEAL
jgi:DNA anti-recombination protein RmuC